MNKFGSFRDPSGYIFEDKGIVYRKIIDTSLLVGLESSGLYKELVEEALMIPYEWVSEDSVKPQQIPFTSYPYEWSFSMLKDAALVTLGICKRAIYRNMILKDASAYNIQYIDGKMKLIDHLSFEPYLEGEPWIAYKQFCQHFLAPLLLMSYKDIRLSLLLKEYIDGIPLDLCNSLLSWNSFLHPSILLHIKLQSKAQKKFSTSKLKRKVNKNGLLGLIDNLESLTKSLKVRKGDSFWSRYVDEMNYSTESLGSKGKAVMEHLEKTRPKIVWDLGCNFGGYSSLAEQAGSYVVAIDSDPYLTEGLYSCEYLPKNILPLCINLTNPSPSIGWMNEERASLIKRGPSDCTMALALIHHLCIANNVTFPLLVNFFSKICKNLIIEWVPKEDSQVQRLLSTRKDIFPWYLGTIFEHEFGKSFNIKEKKYITDSKRVIYLMEAK